MKQKFFAALFLISIVAFGCKSRFTSTSDSTGPRRHDHADPAPESESNVTHGVSDTARLHTQAMTDSMTITKDTLNAKQDTLSASH